MPACATRRGTTPISHNLAEGSAFHENCLRQKSRLPIFVAGKLLPGKTTRISRAIEIHSMGNQNCQNSSHLEKKISRSERGLRVVAIGGGTGLVDSAQGTSSASRSRRQR